MSNETIEAIEATMKEFWGNPSNLYDIGVMAQDIINLNKRIIAHELNCLPEEIFFTSCASENNAWFSIQRQYTVVSEYEHHSILSNSNCICVSEAGIPYELQAIRACNEGQKYAFGHIWVASQTGEVFPVEQYFKEFKKLGVLTYCDATQALGKIPIDLQKLGADMVGFSLHKVHGPRFGIMYINKAVQDKIVPLITGSQQHNLRGGTENIPYIAVSGDIVRQACREAKDAQIVACRLKQAVLKMLQESNIEYIVNQGKTNLNTTVNFCLKNISSEIIQQELSNESIYIGTGSACATGNMEPDSILLTMEVPPEYLDGQIRLSFDYNTKIGDVIIAMSSIIQKYKNIMMMG